MIDLKKVRCPFCGYEMPVYLTPEAESRGVWVRCKGRRCGKKFEVKVKKGCQVEPE